MGWPLLSSWTINICFYKQPVGKAMQSDAFYIFVEQIQERNSVVTVATEGIATMTWLNTDLNDKTAGLTHMSTNDTGTISST